MPSLSREQGITIGSFLHHTEVIKELGWKLWIPLSLEYIACIQEEHLRQQLSVRQTDSSRDMEVGQARGLPTNTSRGLKTCFDLLGNQSTMDFSIVSISVVYANS